jgi:hypothetical protein
MINNNNMEYIITYRIRLHLKSKLDQNQNFYIIWDLFKKNNKFYITQIHEEYLIFIFC